MKLQLHTTYSGSRAVAFELEAVQPAELKEAGVTRVVVYDDIPTEVAS